MSTTIVSKVFDLEEEQGTVIKVTSECETTQGETLEKQHNNDKNQLEPTEALKIFKQCLAILSIFGIFIGADTTYDWKYKYNLRFALTFLVNSFTWSQYFYTQFLYFFQRNITINLEVIAMYGIAASYSLKINCFMKYFKNITALYNSTLKICKVVDGLRAETLKRRLQFSLIFYKCISFLAIPTTIIYMFYPVKSYFWDSKLVPLMPMEIILIDQSSEVGFIIANVVMTLLGIHTIAIVTYMALHFIVLIMSYTLRNDIVEIDFNELDELWKDISTSTKAERRMFLKNICEKCIDMRSYIDEIKIIFDEKLFLFFGFSYLSLILCLYEIRVNNWLSGFAIAFGVTAEMILYCLMGTQLNIQNERLCSIISQSNWYTYDNHSQKLIITLLNLVMNNPELWIGPLKPLSVFTATEILKSIFSYYMVMVETM